MDWAKEEAERICDKWFGRGAMSMFNRTERKRYEEPIATALLAAARVPDGHVRTADGVDRKVLGTLPMTEDGCVAGKGAKLYPLHPIDLGDGDDDCATLELAFYITPPEGGRLDEDDEMKINMCFSTKEAAAIALAAEAATSAAARGVGQ